MAYDKKYPVLNEDVFNYEKDQEDRIEDAFIEVDNDINDITNIGGTVSGTTLKDTDLQLGENTLLIEALESLGIDFPIEWGENSNGHWEKWNSGKLVQWGSYKIQNLNTDYVVPFPIPCVAPNPSDVKIIGNVSRAGGYNGFYAILKGVNSNLENFSVRVETNGSSTTLFDYHWQVFSEWK